MNIRASGRSALIIAAGLWICASGPLHAAENDTQAAEPAATVGSAVDTSAEPAKATRHHSKKTASKSRKSDKQAAKEAKKPAEEDAAKTDDGKAADASTSLTPAVANANAQWPTEAAPVSAATPVGAANVSAQAGGFPTQPGPQPEQPAVAAPDSQASNMQVVASDQLNDLDRAATDGQQPPLTLAKATIDTPQAEASSGPSNSPWDKTSLIGKVFVAFGGLLTMASAARMFMA